MSQVNNIAITGIEPATKQIQYVKKYSPSPLTNRVRSQLPLRNTQVIANMKQKSVFKRYAITPQMNSVTVNIKHTYEGLECIDVNNSTSISTIKQTSRRPADNIYCMNSQRKTVSINGITNNNNSSLNIQLQTMYQISYSEHEGI
ncbi:Hypothetical_protein [Hexamita inflata]|uniref:Hypothetical_protein n=1 Tax=Hexamita inflata TaxID=28002 RepID=A0AA86RGA1_9EUKA|nr:Hypothetical protein HINF_LOCUS61256 [Hexamita inflata]